MQVNLTVNIRDDFGKLFSDHRVTTKYRAVIYRFDCTKLWEATFCRGRGSKTKIWERCTRRRRGGGKGQKISH